MMPPVDVPTIQSNSSVTHFPVRRSISCKMHIWTRPRIPPPSKHKILLPQTFRYFPWSLRSCTAFIASSGVGVSILSMAFTSSSILFHDLQSTFACFGGLEYRYFFCKSSPETAPTSFSICNILEFLGWSTTLTTFIDTACDLVISVVSSSPEILAFFPATITVSPRSRCLICTAMSSTEGWVMCCCA